jgi:hypothetical protein
MVTTSGPKPSDQDLYMKVKEKVKKKIQKTSRWPSAYGSAQLVKQYKQEFKKKYGSKSPYIEKKSTKPKKSTTKLAAKQITKTKKSTKTNKSKKCPKGSRRNPKTGRCRKSTTKKSKKVTKKSNRKNSGLTRWFDEKWVNVCKKKGSSYAPCGRKKVEDSKKYPYCRPLHRINKGTPMTVSELIKKHGSKKIKQMCSKKNTGDSKRTIRV